MTVPGWWIDAGAATLLAALLGAAVVQGVLLSRRARRVRTQRRGAADAAVSTGDPALPGPSPPPLPPVTPARWRLRCRACSRMFEALIDETLPSTIMTCPSCGVVAPLSMATAPGRALATPLQAPPSGATSPKPAAPPQAAAALPSSLPQPGPGGLESEAAGAGSPPRVP